MDDYDYADLELYAFDEEMNTEEIDYDPDNIGPTSGVIRGAGCLPVIVITFLIALFGGK